MVEVVGLGAFQEGNRRIDQAWPWASAPRILDPLGSLGGRPVGRVVERIA